jgi:5'-nucleotidase
MRVLLTNDDGIHAEGLQTLRRELLEVPDIELVVIAPDGNRSAMARSITTRRPLWVERVDFEDGTCGYATDGTPVDCVRLATLGLVEGFEAEAIISGINHGANLGDDITYSGTVAAALEGVLLGLPAIAVSQQTQTGEFDFATVARFAAQLVDRLDEVPLPEGTLLNVNAPEREPDGVEVCKLGKRVYSDELQLQVEEGPRRQYWIYGSEVEHSFVPGDGTDLEAVHAGRIAVTPLHFDLTDIAGMDALRRFDLARMLAPAVE